MSDLAEYCQRCGGSNITWHAPSPLWNAVMRYPDGREANERWGIVCPQCFVEIAEKNGVVKDAAWHLDARHGGVTVELATVSHDGRLWDSEACLWVAPAPDPAPQRSGEEDIGHDLKCMSILTLGGEGCTCGADEGVIVLRQESGDFGPCQFCGESITVKCSMGGPICVNGCCEEPEEETR